MAQANLPYLTHYVLSLFNRPFRTIKKEQLVNTINGGDCEIQVEFEVGTMVNNTR